MKSKLIAVIMQMFLITIIACTNSKKTTDNSTISSMKANLIDGSWEANYIMNTPKPFADLYANSEPAITFNSSTGKVNGQTGCNDFNGTFSFDGNKLNFGENMALTRKMCPDMAGEKIFIETLKKVNSYSVTEQGKTLNLISDDMAVMRLTKK